MKFAAILFVLSFAPRFDAFEKTIPELAEALDRGEVTSRELVRQYLERIEAFDRGGPALNSLLYVNPRALEEADALDRERRERGSRGPLHGIPVVLKDNYDTRDMPTTASSVALTGFIPRDDAFQVRKLREAGAELGREPRGRPPVPGERAGRVLGEDGQPRVEPGGEPVREMTPLGHQFGM